MQPIKPLFLQTHGNQISIQIETSVAVPMSPIEENLASIQEIAQAPVEIHSLVFKGKTIISLTTTASTSKAVKIVDYFMKGIRPALQSPDIVLLIATGNSKIDFEGQNSWAFKHIVTPLAKHRQTLKGMKKQELVRLDPGLPTNPDTKQDAELVIANNRAINGAVAGSRKQLLQLVATACLNLDDVEFHKGQSADSVVPVLVGENKKAIPRIIEQVNLFDKTFLTGAKSTKDKKIGQALQFLISSGSLTHTQLKQAQTLMQTVFVTKAPPKRPQ